MNQNEKIRHIIESLNEALSLIANNKGENINNIDKDLALGKIRMAYDFILKLETKEVSNLTVNILSQRPEPVKGEVEGRQEFEITKKVIEKENIPIIEKKIEITEEVKVKLPIEKAPEIKVIENTVIDEIKPVTINPDTIIVETELKQNTKEVFTETQTSISSGSKTISEQYQDNKSKTLSDSLFKTNKDFSTTQQLKPIKNIKSAISINDRVMFSRDLFENNSTLYNESIDKINEMKNLDEAKEFIAKTIKLKEETDSYNKFLELVHRRFA